METSFVIFLLLCFWGLSPISVDSPPPLHTYLQRNNNRSYPQPQLRTAREAVKISAVGGIIGAVSTAGVTWKYSRSLHGTALSLGAGAVFGWTFGQEVANHWLQLYRLDTMAAQVKFMEWWQNKVEGQ